MLKILVKSCLYIWNRIPYKFMILIIILSLSIGEFYPISNFPMYSRFDNRSGCIYVTNSQNEIIPTSLEFGVANHKLSKIYVSSLKKLNNNNSKAGEETLLYLIDHKKTQLGSQSSDINFKELKLWRLIVTVNVKNKKIIKTQEIITSIKL